MKLNLKTTMKRNMNQKMSNKMRKSRKYRQHNNITFNLNKINFTLPQNDNFPYHTIYPYVNKYNYSNNVSTQLKFYECITDSMLNTLLKRVDNGKLKNDIQNSIHNNIKTRPNDLYITTELSYLNNPNPGIYIHINSVKDGIYLHWSIHLLPDNFSYYKGPIHITNNNQTLTTQPQTIPQKRLHRIRVEQANNKSIFFMLGNPYKRNVIPEKYFFIFEHALQILNNYFNKNHKDFLGKINSLANPHPNLKYIVNLMNNRFAELGIQRIQCY